MAYSYDVFQIVFFVFLLGLGSEVVLFIWCYQSSSFKTIDQAINKQSRKSDAVRGSSVKSGRAKKSERVEGSLKKAATKELAVMKVKQSLVTALGAVGMYMLLGRLYSNQVVAKLPFEAHWLITKLSQRGLTNPALNDCAMAFIYMLCQTGIRMNLQHFLGWGPSRKMQAMSSWQQVADEGKMTSWQQK